MQSSQPTSSSLEEVLVEDHLTHLNKVLTADLVAAEDMMIQTWATGNHKISKNHSSSYMASLNELVKRLRKIADSLFHETKINKVKPYRESDKIPDNYQNYLHVSKNLPLTVCYDILSKPTIEHAIAAFERWIFICMLSFHQHDFFTSTCIISGLNAKDISKSKLDCLLSNSSQQLLNYYRNMLDKDALLYHRQKSLLKYRLDYIPALHVLVNMYEKVDFKAESTDLDKMEVQVKRRALSKDFAIAKKKNSANLSLEEDIILHWLYRRAGNELLTIVEDKASQLRKIIDSANGNRDYGDSSGSFSISKYMGLNDTRIRLILLVNEIEVMQKEEKVSDSLLYNVKTIICNAENIDRAIYAKINEEFFLNGHVLNKPLKKLHKNLIDLLTSLIEYERINGIYFTDQDLKVDFSDEESSTTKPASAHEKPIRLVSSTVRLFSNKQLPASVTEEGYSKEKEGIKIDVKIKAINISSSEESMEKLKK